MDESEAVDQTAELVERVAAIDVAKASGMLCLRLPHERIEGRRTQRVSNVGATTNAILELGDHLLCQGVTRVVMEATGSYWKPWFYLLEARGLSAGRSTPATSRTSRAAPRPTNSTRCGCASSPNGACFGLPSCRPSRSGNCAT